MRYAIAAAVAVALFAGACATCPKSHADPSTTDEVCGGYNLGLTQDQIAQGLQRNDHRINEWQAWKDTNWPIIEGQCG